MNLALAPLVLAMGPGMTAVVGIVAVGLVVYALTVWLPLPVFFKRAVYVVGGVVVAVLLYHFLRAEVPELFAW